MHHTSGTVPGMPGTTTKALGMSGADKLYKRTMTTWLLMQRRLLSTIHRYNRRTSINMDLEENTMLDKEQRSNHNHLTIKTAVLSGDNDGRDCERRKESREILL